MTYAEIADHLEVPQSTVEALLFRARRALRREFFAVAGDGRLAGIPLVGALLRRLATVRDRVAEQMPSVSQLSTGAAASAMAVVLATVPFSPSAPTAGAAAAPARVPNVATTSFVSPAATPPPSAAVDGTPTTTGPQPAAVEPATPPAAVETMSADEARSDAADMPVVLDGGGAGAGVDPTEALGWARTYLQGEDR
jgi:hypothetical protein